MEDFVQKMSQKVGIDKATAERVMSFLKDNAGDAMKYLSGGGGKGQGGIAEKVGKML